MSQNSYSSQRKCDCGLVVKTLISSTTSNPGRRFFRCLCSDVNVKIEMENLKIEIESLKIVMENLKIEGGHLLEKISKLEETNDLEVEEVRTFEDKYYKTKYKFMISCFLFVGFVVALITK
ncbi:hypothetical protein R3W88_022651 [Solanum pinnatisectum]|uniref:Zinc finger GRF-type domain-containing protein n=1 Tax=Solanum pinnatisectum TaxID=50273 RepID=A0AAV9LW16_9SOLN|nr:hypothetical protein R3W88_022651 [Solanum pinnatisectum]